MSFKSQQRAKNRYPSTKEILAQRQEEQDKEIARRKAYVTPPGMWRIPALIDRGDLLLGNIKHMPRWEQIPEPFKSNYYNNSYCEFISSWFHRGQTKEGLQRLREKPGVDRSMALGAIRSIMVSFDPQHEHKIAACGFLLNEWFILEGV